MLSKLARRFCPNKSLLSLRRINEDKKPEKLGLPLCIPRASGGRRFITDAEAT